jgi:putative phosphoribosyl transferase
MIAYRDDRPEPDLTGRTVILVDDGLATGASMYSAVVALRQRKPAEIAVAVPVAPAETCRSLQHYADRVFCPYQLEHFGAVGLYYANFAQVSDDEVRRLLNKAENERKSCKVA